MIHHIYSVIFDWMLYISVQTGIPMDDLPFALLVIFIGWKVGEHFENQKAIKRMLEEDRENRG